MASDATKPMMLASTLLCWLVVTAGAAESNPAGAPRQAPPKAIKNWQDKRFGMFIHWGPISLKGTEIGWSRIPGPNGTTDGTVLAEEYETLYRQVNPPKFNAEALVTLA